MPIKGVGGTEVEVADSAFAFVRTRREHRVARVGISHVRPFQELLVFLYLGGCEITGGAGGQGARLSLDLGASDHCPSYVMTIDVAEGMLHSEYCRPGRPEADRRSGRSADKLGGGNHAYPDAQSGEAVMIGDDVTITVLGVKGNQVRVGVNAPKSVAVHSEEIYERIKRERVLAGSKPDEPVKVR